MPSKVSCSLCLLRGPVLQWRYVTSNKHEGKAYRPAGCGLCCVAYRVSLVSPNQCKEDVHMIVWFIAAQLPLWLGEGDVITLTHCNTSNGSVCFTSFSGNATHLVCGVTNFIPTTHLKAENHLHLTVEFIFYTMNQVFLFSRANRRGSHSIREPGINILVLLFQGACVDRVKVSLTVWSPGKKALAWSWHNYVIEVIKYRLLDISIRHDTHELSSCRSTRTLGTYTRHTTKCCLAYSMLRSGSAFWCQGQTRLDDGQLTSQ